ncbi:MerR family transcriptional regulator [Ornithinimicrobium sp. F0845]|uniref:MerR family transcriptional regulator n=1 Tax=Ornithinimicrobium sp. F0845 TaxID=2926412 RepID=UPI001FF38F0E|nr:MerR family transcriptional regulator [Ornithinimicrobium sp. F0845]MCK0113092.1 MerR family transcriptional regulator [Ornithinimicrobium sp. F0845]
MRYTVKQVSAMTGVAPDTLRAWERRYGVVTPARSESRYRLYDDHDLDRLRTMARLVAAGAPASLAAQQVIAELPEDATPAEPSPPRAESGAPIAPAGPTPAVDALVAPAQHLDRGQVDRVLDQALAAGSFESVAEHWLLPALHGLGEAWADGRVDVAGEHFVSAAVQGRLARAFDAAGTALGGPVALVGLPPGSLHELGAHTFAVCLRRLGVDVRWLGSDVPLDSWVHAVRRLVPDAAVLSVPTGADTAAAAAVTARLRQVDAKLLVFVGGQGAAAGEDFPRATTLPESVVAAAWEVAGRLRAQT